MNIGLIDVDSHNFPNLCLMKLAAYHKAQGDRVEWYNHDRHYDIVYQSKVFDDTYSKDIDFVPNATQVIKGGTGYGLENRLPDAVEHAETEGGAFRRSCTAALGKVRQMLIWNKNSFTMGHQDYQWKHEACIYGWTDGAAHYFVDDRTQATVIEDKRIDINKLKKDEMRELLRDIFSDKVSTTILNEDKPARNDDHPTMKPLKLLARLVKNSSRQGDIVLDTFGGSGSTLITCQQLGRRCYTMELDPRYADVIVKRYMKFTGVTQVEVIRNGKKIVVT